MNQKLDEKYKRLFKASPDGRLDLGRLLSKPYARLKLAAKVRWVLREPIA